jgi:hypothetical protein
MQIAVRIVQFPHQKPNRFQGFIDAVFFELAGLTKDEVAGLKIRYEAIALQAE